MKFFDWLRGASQTPVIPPVDRAELQRQCIAKTEELIARYVTMAKAGQEPYWEEYDFYPDAHLPVLKYLQMLWQGYEPNPELEKTSLRYEMKMKGINFSALMFLVAKEREIPLERVLWFLSPSTQGADDSTAMVFRKIMIMAESGMNEVQYLAAVVAGDRLDPRQASHNRAQILSHADNLGFVVKFAYALESLKGLKLHAAFDVKYGEIVADPGWEQ
jgi:hypothetical protein